MPKHRLVNLETGEVSEVTRVPHQLEGKGYTMQAHGAEVPLYALGLTGAEWSVIDWLKEHRGCVEPVGIDTKAVAAGIGISEPAVKKALTRLVKLNLAIRTTPRSSTYQLNPLRFWEGTGKAQALRLRSEDPPRVQPDKKALGTQKNGVVSPIARKRRDVG